MKQDYGKFTIELESDDGLEELKVFIQKQNVTFTPDNEERIIRRLRITTRRYGLKTFTELLNLMENNPKVQEDFLDWLEKGKIYDETSKSFSPLLERKKSLKNIIEETTRKSKKKKGKRKKIQKQPVIFLFQSDPPDPENVSLIYGILSRKKINYQAYKEKYFLRRLNSRMLRVRALTYREYSKILETDPTEVDQLISNLSINVTRFFRDKDLFYELERKILPRIFEHQQKSVRIWSAGCAIGAEPYSIAILVSHLFKKSSLYKTTILATDIKNEFLLEARRGIFNEEMLKEVKPLFIQSYFNNLGQGTVQISSEIRKSVTFQVHDLRDPPPAQKFDLIVCRNVLIYFSRDQSISLFERFYEALNPEAYLAIGKCELLPPPLRTKFLVVNPRTRIYQVKK